MIFKNHFRIMIVCAFYAVFNSINAQTDSLPSIITLQKEEIQETCQRYQLKIQEFQMYLSDIVNTKISNAQRRASIEATLDLFMGRGKSYYIRNEDGEIEYRNPVRIQVSSTSGDKKRWIPMTKYLSNLYENVNRYGKVEINQPVLVSIEPNLIKIDDSLYKGIGIIESNFKSTNQDGRRVHADSIYKKTDIYLSPIATPVGRVWSIKLGDIFVTSSKADF